MKKNLYISKFFCTFAANLKITIMKNFRLSSFKRRLRQSIVSYSNHLDFLFSKCLNDYEKTLDQSYNFYSKKLLKLFLFCTLIQTMIFLLFCLICSIII